MDSLKINDSYYRYNHHFRYKLSDSILLQKILEIDDELKHAYDLKEQYTIFNSSTSDIEKIAEELDTLISAYLISGIHEFVEIGNTMTNWKEEIINSFHTYEGRRINNGPIEGRNKYIKIITGLANGYKNFKRPRNRILFVFNRHEKPSEERLDTKLLKLPGKERGKYKTRKH